MEQKEKKDRVKAVIIILAVLLVLSLAALAGTLIYNHVMENKHATVTVPDNLITPDEGMADDTDTTGSADSTADNPNRDSEDAQNTAANTTAKKEAATISLYNKQPQENMPFNVGNMFPGDAITRYYRVQVSYQDKVTVHYHADVRPGYEKLAEVLKVRITLLTSGETMYDGLMRDMPESVSYQLASRERTTDELYYEITAYLDTSVGNDYQNKDLVADFRWWVEETGNLGPKTGDSSNIMLWVLLTLAAGAALAALIVIRRRKEGKKYE